MATPPQYAENEQTPAFVSLQGRLNAPRLPVTLDDWCAEHRDELFRVIAWLLDLLHQKRMEDQILRNRSYELGIVPPDQFAQSDGMFTMFDIWDGTWRDTSIRILDMIRAVRLLNVQMFWIHSNMRLVLLLRQGTQWTGTETMAEIHRELQWSPDAGVCNILSTYLGIDAEVSSPGIGLFASIVGPDRDDPLTANKSYPSGFHCAQFPDLEFELIIRAFADLSLSNVNVGMPDESPPAEYHEEFPWLDKLFDPPDPANIQAIDDMIAANILPRELNSWFVDHKKDAYAMGNYVELKLDFCIADNKLARSISIRYGVAVPPNFAASPIDVSVEVDLGAKDRRLDDFWPPHLVLEMMQQIKGLEAHTLWTLERLRSRVLLEREYARGVSSEAIERDLVRRFADLEDELRYEADRKKIPR
ncbi:unnamed protein product [Zymoseptoria tritici ST99CH_3D7]|uniref:Uncharacterized protein n=1 Tax=Zymoseptoria tritici (strain ST99CH_3D7) TaxID=1276538 RepID=A0A1X7RZE2_ZYMT9|nr:unnamed protein product [Zymoseptoria tritici ST99CH_3D7]